MRPGTRFDPTESQLGRTKKRREKNRFQCNEIILEVSSQLFSKDHATSDCKIVFTFNNTLE